MAEAILLVVSKIGAVVLNETVSAVVEKVSRKLDNLKELPGKINRINTELEAMNAVIQELGTTHLANKVVKSWIGNVRKLAYHVEDVIDKYTYEALKLKDEGFLHRYIFRGSRHIKVFGKIAEEVAEIEDEIKHVKELHIYWSNTVQPTKNEHAQVDRRFFGGCFPELVSDKDLVGIDENRQKLTEWLTTDENENTVSAVSGMGGLGKTALVKNVYDRKKVNFHAHAWIVVSQSYHIVDLLEKFLIEIYESLQKSKPPVSADTKANVYELTESIQKILQDKKCLIVLDDVWDIEAYTQMRSAFQGLQGSRVVITTRREDVAALAPPRRRLLLQPLSSDESFKLFCARAFHNSPDRKCPPELEMLAAAIVDKCHGLPLAIVSSGSLLSTKQQTEDAWNHIYNHLQSELRGNNHVQAILNLSYQDLPGDLRNCLLYCSLFPEDYVMSLESLVQLWVAEGFAMKKDNSTPEEVAKGNLMELIGRNMLEVVERDRFNKVSTCRMHDIVRDLALAVAKEERFGSANDQGEMMLMDKEVRRFSTFEWSDNKTSALRVEFPRLRTMISLAADSSSTNMISSVLSGSSYLTVLELQDSEITQVPASIGNLFNLRYIGLRRTNVQTLPDTIEKLSNLETLNVRQTRIEKLPPGIVKNEKLRHLSADRFTGEKFRYFAGVEAPRMISNFQQLQTLETVHASKDLSLQLKKMNKLQNVRIDDMNASHCDDLCHALSDMPLLSSLFLSACDEKETLCFQALKPVSKRLHTLIIRGSWGDGALKCPIFQGHGKNLKYLALSWCNLGNEDPLQLLGSSHLPVLTHLSFNWVSTAGVLVLSAGCFSQLKILILRSMSNVKQMVIKEGALPCIDGIYITDLLELSMVPHGIESLGSLKKLWMIDLHKDFKADWDLNQMHSKMKHVPELRTT